MKNFINEEKISAILDDSQRGHSHHAESILKKALNLKGLSPEEAAILLNCEDDALLDRLYTTARQIKEEIYGKRLVLFAPLYLSNRCINSCSYCGFSHENTSSGKRLLDMQEIRDETKALISQGHKRLLLVSAEDPEVSIDYLQDAIKTVYETKEGNGAIRRINVNVAPMRKSDFKKLKSTGIGTYQSFQETYHIDTYKQQHTSGPKSDYLKRLYACDNAQSAGIDDVGIGALFGLHDYKYEVLAILFHAIHLEEVFGVGPHTISVPRLEPAQGSEIASHPPSAVSDKELKKIIAVLRLSVPYTGIILSTRENAGLRKELCHLGVSQVSAGSRTMPGSYSSKDKSNAQFTVSDNRSLSEVVSDLAASGFIPSFCTSCYRTGRTGEDFMDLAKPGDIKNYCQPNAILTFEEYLLDYNPELAQSIKPQILSEVSRIPDHKIREATLGKMESLVQGKRDQFF